MAPSEVLLNTARAYLNALSTIDAEGIAATTNETFHITIAPSSTGLSGHNGVSTTRQDLMHHFTGLKAVLSSMNVHIEQEWPPNEASNQVTVWTTANGEFHPHIVGDDSKEDWVFRPETLFLFTMDTTGKKIERLVEFQDSLAVQGMGQLFGKAMGRLGHPMPDKSE